LDILDKAGLLSGKTSIIHGTALNDSDFTRLAQAGTSLIWSPRSNISLYGETESLPSLLSKHIAVALAPDWSINGSTNMLAELHYARSLVSSTVLFDQRLFEMATIVPAQLAGLSDQIGSLAIGKRADLFVLRSAKATPFSAVVSAHPQDVLLVMVNGRALFGSQDQLSPLLFGADFTLSKINICGSERLLAMPLPETSMRFLTQHLTETLVAFGVDLAPVTECY
jgi:cytosine/adenosine deaminase-related metal-dependent hydrolase